MAIIILIIKLLSISWFLTYIPQILNEVLNVIKQPKIILKIPAKILSCLMCTSFCLTLIVTFNFPLACLLSFLSYLINKYLLPTKTNL